MAPRERGRLWEGVNGMQQQVDAERERRVSKSKAASAATAATAAICRHSLRHTARAWL